MTNGQVYNAKLNLKPSPPTRHEGFYSWKLEADRDIVHSSKKLVAANNQIQKTIDCQDKIDN